MPEMIQFPDKKGQLRGNATRKMLAHDYLAAKKDWLALYDLDPVFEVMTSLVETLRLLGDFEGAIFYASEYEQDCLKTEATLTDYVRLYLLNGQYLFAHRLLTKYPNERLEAELLQLEMAQDLLGETDYASRATQLSTWDSQIQPIGGQKWQNWLKKMTLTGFIQLAKNHWLHLKNPFILPKLIEEFIACGVKEKVVVKSVFKGEQLVDLANCRLFHDAPALILMKQLVEKFWLNQDPQIMEAITIEAQAHFALLYPFLPTLSEVPDWEKSYRYEYQAVFGDEKAAEALAAYPEIQQLKTKIRAYYHEFA